MSSDRQRMSDALNELHGGGVAWVTYGGSRIRLVAAGEHLVLGLTYVFARRGGYTVGVARKRKCQVGESVERAQVGNRWVGKRSVRARVDYP